MTIFEFIYIAFELIKLIIEFIKLLRRPDKH